MKKMKRPFIKKEAPSYMRHVCNAAAMNMIRCWEIRKMILLRVRRLKSLPEEWICPECGEAKDQFIETLD